MPIETKVQGRRVVIEEGWVKTARLEEEWYEDLDDPQGFVSGLRAQDGLDPDLFTFWQRLPDSEPRYAYHQEWEHVAALPITTYKHWWKNQIKGRIRNLVRKAKRRGVEVRRAEWDDDFIQGMTKIFNETPVRQGRPFLHYGKDFETVKREFSRFLFREDLIGAYFEGELIGFIMLAHAGPFSLTGQIISLMAHRDKATNNALIAKAVEICAEKNVPYLVYYFWTEDSLAEFKRRCGFEKVALPRYYVPLTLRGSLALRLGLHKGFKEAIPAEVKNRLKGVRKFWYQKVRGREAA